MTLKYYWSLKGHKCFWPWEGYKYFCVFGHGRAKNIFGCGRAINIFGHGRAISIFGLFRAKIHLVIFRHYNITNNQSVHILHTFQSRKIKFAQILSTSFCFDSTMDQEDFTQCKYCGLKRRYILNHLAQNLDCKKHYTEEEILALKISAKTKSDEKKKQRKR